METTYHATYKTMQYDLPLFLVCVRTNVGYCAVAEFVTQSETTEAISEALNVLKEWNPTHLLSYVITQKQKFQQSKLCLSQFKCTCDFHREQAWTRWVNKSQHGLSSSEADILLSLLRKCAWAPSSQGESDTHYQEAVKQLEDSDVWKNHDRVRSWLLSTWLNIPKVHCIHIGLVWTCRANCG